MVEISFLILSFRDEDRRPLHAYALKIHSPSCLLGRTSAWIDTHIKPTPQGLSGSSSFASPFKALSGD